MTTITNKTSRRFAALAGGMALAVALMGAVAIAPARAASLTAAQVQAIVSLLASFGADPATIANVTAALSGQATAGTGAACPVLTRSLSLGSTGADVMSLQKFLNTSADTRVAVSGAGSPGLETTYFGPATRAAVIKFQAKNSVSPIGVVGPATRAAIVAVCGTSGGNTGGNTGGSTVLKGGEADLRSFDLVSGDNLSEGDSNREIAVAKFDVRGGDVQVQRVTVELTAQSGSASASKLPWKFIDSLAVYSDGKKAGSVDASSKSDWDKDGNTYSIDIPVSAIVREGDRAELSVRADAQNTIDSADLAQTFKVVIPANGIRAVDAKGIQQYTGKDGDSVTLGFDAAQNGKLTLREASDSPDAGILVADSSETSDDLQVLSFELRNRDDADADLNSITVHVATSSPSGSAARDISDIIRRATLKAGSRSFDGTVNADNTIEFDNLDSITVRGNSTAKFTLSVELFAQSGHYAASGETLRFSVGNADIDAEGSDTGDASDVSGSANGELQSIALNAGIGVAGSTMSASQVYNENHVDASYGTFTLKFKVTANGDDVYIPKTVQALDSGDTPNANTGVVVLTDLNASTTSSGITASMTTTAESDNSDFYVVRDGDTETFTVLVTINPTATGDYQVGLDKIRFSTVDTGFGSIQTLDVDQNASQFHTDSVNIRN
jgi:hypothetical protein